MAPGEGFNINWRIGGGLDSVRKFSGLVLCLSYPFNIQDISLCVRWGCSGIAWSYVF